MRIGQTRALLLWPALGALLVASWQAATVYSNFNGNWTALFYTGDRSPIPPHLEPSTYVFRGSPGYDGQWYRYIAHDPLGKGEEHSYVDAPPLRYRRILISGLAAILAFGRDGAIDAVYIAVLLAFIFAGCYWCGVAALRRGKHPAFGLLFLAVPATLISVDRMTVDVALTALAAGAIVYWDDGKLVRCFLCIAAGCLARETGVLIAAGWVVALLLRRQWRMAAIFATAVAPAGAWFFYLRSAFPDAPRGQSIPLWLFHWNSGILGRLIDPVRYGFAAPLETLVRSFDAMALAGMLAALVISGVVIFQKRLYPPAIAVALHLVLFAIVNSKGFWDTVYGYARPFSPMIVLAALSLPAAGKLRLALMAATLAMTLRVLLQMGPQLLGILR